MDCVPPHRHRRRRQQQTTNVSSSEDSGCATGANTSILVHEDAPAYHETPTISGYVASSHSRKRKVSEIYMRAASFDLSESPVVDLELDRPNLLSSTLNESLTKSLERCNLKGDVNNVQPSKKYKANDGPEYQPKTRSAPSTPTKHFDIDDSNAIGKSFSENLDALVPERRRNNYNRTMRLGSPERLQLLYPTLKPTPSPPKLKTPEKLREFMKRINSPAKKRLFDDDDEDKPVRKPYKRIDTDPVSVFLVRNDFRHVVAKIFAYLSDKDLCAVVRVSKLWKRAVMSDLNAYPRYFDHSQKFKVNKENCTPPQSSFACRQLKISPPVSPERDSFHRCRRIVPQLLPSQNLRKCPRCMKPAVVDRTISQCQNFNCGYIYCVNCLSFSTVGPEGFVDKCNASEFMLEKRAGLADASNLDRELPLFLTNNNNNDSSIMSQSRCDSSGYYSEMDSGSSPFLLRKRHSLNKVDFNVLQNYNKQQKETCLRLKNRRSSLISPVISSSTTPPTTITEIMEPSSPPKITLVACSKQSKRNLKRLQF